MFSYLDIYYAMLIAYECRRIPLIARSTRSLSIAIASLIIIESLNIIPQSLSVSAFQMPVMISSSGIIQYNRRVVVKVSRWLINNNDSMIINIVNLANRVGAKEIEIYFKIANQSFDLDKLEENIDYFRSQGFDITLDVRITSFDSHPEWPIPWDIQYYIDRFKLKIQGMIFDFDPSGSCGSIAQVQQWLTNTASLLQNAGLKPYYYHGDSAATFHPDSSVDPVYLSSIGYTPVAWNLEKSMGTTIDSKIAPWLPNKSTSGTLSNGVRVDIVLKPSHDGQNDPSWLQNWYENHWQYVNYYNDWKSLEWEVMNIEDWPVEQIQQAMVTISSVFLTG